MHFDDRIATVLRQLPAGEAIARIQFRQLLDLLGTAPGDAGGRQMDAAWLRLSDLAAKIPAAERAAMLREPALRLRNPRLVAALAASEPEIAAEAMAAARLDERQWLDLVPALPVGVRSFVRHRSALPEAVEALLDRLGVHDRALPPGAGISAGAPSGEAPTTEALATEAPAPGTPAPGTLATETPAVKAPGAETIAAVRTPLAAVAEGAGRLVAANDVTPDEPPAAELLPPLAPLDGIGAIVRRIEEFRKARRPAEHDGGDANAGPPAPRPQPARGFDFATDAEGRIVWAEPAIAPMAVGLRLGAGSPEAPVQCAASLAVALRHRQPVRAAIVAIEGAPAIAGDWQVDAAPRFDPQGGRFIGYCGRMRRPVAQPPALPADSDADRMRQILHELRTPVNAIQGFAEVIQQQLFGPTPHEYRALAASIAGDSARMLAGFEELERLIKLDGGALELDPGECDLAAVVAATVAQLGAFTAPRRSGFAADIEETVLLVPLARVEAERMVWRLLATLAGAAAPNETLKLRLRRRDGDVRLTVRLPASLAGREEEDLLHAAATRPQGLATGMFGAGFTLRLAGTEAAAAGGSLAFAPDRLRLTLPGLTRPAAAHSQEQAVLVAHAEDG
jgi:hypothetical protein